MTGSGPERTLSGMAPARPPSHVSADTDDVGFLDAPGLAADTLFDTVGRVLDRMPDGSILTVYTDDAAAPEEAAGWCARRDVDLLAVIRHEPHGTTLALRRPGRRR